METEKENALKLPADWVKMFTRSLRSVASDALKITFELYKLMIPVLVITRLLELAGLITFIGSILSPIMALMGLPGSMGLVWAASLTVGTYGALLVFVTLLPAIPLNVAQITILLTIILIAHSIPVEMVISRRAGMNMIFHISLRIGGALLYGWMLNKVYSWGGWLQQPGSPAIKLSAPDPTWLGWALSQLQNLGMIFLIILAVLSLIRMLEATGVIAWLVRILNPGLSLIGIGPQAAPITLVGVILGLTIGGSLIIREANSGKIQPRDMFFSLALMGLLHSIIEDTLTMVVFGADLSGLLWGRIVFSLAVIFILVKLLKPVSDTAFSRYLYQVT